MILGRRARGWRPCPCLFRLGSSSVSNLPWPVFSALSARVHGAMRISGGPARGRKFARSCDIGVRPPLARLRQSVFSIIQDRIDASRVLDLFAGSGAFGLEALSRGARHVLFVEQSQGTARNLEENLRSLGFRSRARVLRANALAELAAADADAVFDLVFVDPPFRLFEQPRDREALRARVQSLLSGSSLASGGLIVLRTPGDAEPPFDAACSSVRRYGRSSVWLIEKDNPAVDGSTSS